MAIPRVFISSTCYDLNEIRDTLEVFLESLFFDAILSDKGHVYYQPGLHTHDSCLKEVSNCDLFILVIGGRYGGTYIGDENKSIVNAEYDSAVKESIPIVSFIKKSVWDNHFFYKKNTDVLVQNKIQYPAIENQKTAVKIFEFIDKVRLADKNNGIFPFNTGNEIIDILKKQFAGMIFEHLLNERKVKNFNLISEQLHDLKLISTKSTDLIEKLFLELSQKADPDSEIKEIEFSQTIINFFFHVNLIFNIKYIDDWKPLIFIDDYKTIAWFEYLTKSSDFQIIHKKNELLFGDVIVHTNSLKSILINKEDKNYKVLERYYNRFQLSDIEDINKIIYQIFTS